MYKINQKGFTLVEGLLIVLVIAVLGIGGYLVWNKNKTVTPAKSDTPATASQSNEQKSSDLVISQWNVKATVPTALTGVTYTIKGNTAALNSDQQKEISNSCGNELNPQSAWGIVREASGSIMSADGTALSDSEAVSTGYEHIGNFFYYRSYPQAGCENETAKVGTIDSAYKTLFSSLQAN